MSRFPSPSNRGGMPAMGKNKMPNLPPLRRGGNGHGGKNSLSGDTGFGYSPVTAEIAKARAMLTDQMREIKQSDPMGGMGNSPVARARNQARQLVAGDAMGRMGGMGGGRSLVNLSRTTTVSAPAVPGHNKLFGHGHGGGDNLWGKDGSKSARRDDGRDKLPAAMPRLRPGRKLKSLAKKRGRRRRKKMAARTIQSAWRSSRKKNQSVAMLQACIRGFVARRHVKRMKQAKEAGVMVAMKGTLQGKSGWYQDFDGQTYFFAVDPKGVWWQVMRADQWAERSDELENVPVLVCCEGQKLGEPGKYREYGMKGCKKKPRKWRVLDNGIWTRK